MAQALPIPRLARTQAEPLLATIGNTPLLRLDQIVREFPDVEIFGKAEYFNPGGSVKDRAALNMVLDGERSGKLNPRRIILDATSGNTGIAYAMIGANRGYRVKLCLPENASEERKRILQAYGAEMVFSAADESSDGAIRLCRKLYLADPDAYFYPDQYNNPANWKAHFEGTGPEIIEQTGGTLTHFVASMGTSGTFMGVTETCGSKPRTPTAWCGDWRVRKGCWWGFPPAPTCTPPRCWRANSRRAAKARPSSRCFATAPKNT